MRSAPGGGVALPASWACGDSRNTAASTVPSHIEPYLVRLMARAMAEIRDPVLRADIEVFNKQEVEHCTRRNAWTACRPPRPDRRRREARRFSPTRRLRPRTSS